MTPAIPRLALAIAMLLATTAASHAAPPPRPDRGGVPESALFDYGVMGPPATPALVQAADQSIKVALPPGPFRPDWVSIEAHYKSPAWIEDDKFGIFIHWGLYSVAAYRNEWYEKHMYAAVSDWHAQNLGPHERFGYKDLIPAFTAASFDATEWVELFRKAGARFVVPAAQHHDNFALWDSQVTPFNAKAMGPKRDLIGELATATRQQGMRFGVSNHGVENFTFINPKPEIEQKLKALKADLYDPKWSKFYNVEDRSPAALQDFLVDWTLRNFELIDKYQPDLLWFDNGANLRVLDPLKLRVAAYYYNRALAWKRDVTVSTKFVAFAPSNDDSRQIGSVIDFEKTGKRSPAAIRKGPWLVDDAIGSTWGYTEGMTVLPASVVIAKLVDTVAKGGTYLLNISPKGDGSIPKAQADVLRAIGQWLGANGEAIYGTRAWTQFGDKDWRFTSKGDVLYAISLNEQNLAQPITASMGKVTAVRALGYGPVDFRQDGHGLQLLLPATMPQARHMAFAIRFAP